MAIEHRCSVCGELVTGDFCEAHPDAMVHSTDAAPKQISEMTGEELAAEIARLSELLGQLEDSDDDVAYRAAWERYDLALRTRGGASGTTYEIVATVRGQRQDSAEYLGDARGETYTSRELAERVAGELQETAAEFALDPETTYTVQEAA